MNPAATSRFKSFAVQVYPVMTADPGGNRLAIKTDAMLE
jgi:hypothetical protein